MTQDTIKTTLIAARALINKPDKWTQGALHRNSAGNSVAGDDPDVATRCAAGAIRKACQCVSPFAENEIRSYLIHSINYHDVFFGITSWNDDPDRTHAEVMLAFDRAIEDASDADQA